MSRFLSPYRQQRLFLILFFVCFGMTVEIFFTAFSALLSGESVQGKPPLALAGYTYVWMAFIYGLIPVLAPPFHVLSRRWPAALRLGAIVLFIYLIEFSAGYLLRITTGSCPWEYQQGWHIAGLIRVDYLPAWTIFAWGVEKVYGFANQLTGSPSATTD